MLKWLVQKNIKMEELLYTHSGLILITPREKHRLSLERSVSNAGFAKVRFMVRENLRLMQEQSRVHVVVVEEMSVEQDMAEMKVEVISVKEVDVEELRVKEAQAEMSVEADAGLIQAFGPALRDATRNRARLLALPPKPPAA